MKAFCIYGPPGTGKTYEMMERVAHVKDRGYTADEVIYVSFTRAGANEALSRLGLKRSDTVCTLHSLMFKMNDVYKNAVVSNTNIKEFVNRIGFKFKGINTEDNNHMEDGDICLAILNRARVRKCKLSEEYNRTLPPVSLDRLVYFCQHYMSWKKANGFVDFTDMLSMYVENPIEHSARVMFIDEAQDLSNLQWLVIDTLIKYGKIEEVHIAGDDDQAIYEWAGANPHGMVEFEQRYGAERLVLSKSRRIPLTVFTLAKMVTDKIKGRVHKPYEPRDERGLVIEIPQSRFSLENYNKPDTMILYRTNKAKYEMEKALINRKIPYSVEGGYSRFTDKYAKAIKVWHKIYRGEDISAIEQKQLNKVLLPRYQHVDDYTQLVKGHYKNVIDLPYQNRDFYIDADFEVEPNIKLSTIHASKGREAANVILDTGLSDQMYDKIIHGADDEHRVWYVGVTRSSKNLILINQNTRISYTDALI